MFGALPIIIAGMAVEMAILADGGDATKQAVSNKGSRIIGEVVSSVRTVASFSLEVPFKKAYTTVIDENLAKDKIKSLGKAFGPALSQLTLFCTFGFMYWYGNVLLLKGDDWGPTHVKIEAAFGLNAGERMFVSIFAIFMIGAGLGVAGQDATDMAAATKHARTVFELLATKP